MSSVDFSERLAQIKARTSSESVKSPSDVPECTLMYQELKDAYEQKDYAPCIGTSSFKLCRGSHLFLFQF